MSYCKKKKIMSGRIMFKGCFSPQLRSTEDDHDSKAAGRKTKTSMTSTNSITTRIIRSNGEVRIYKRPITAWELMEEFPKHLVCRSDCFYIGEKTQALSQHDKLQPGHNYFILPSTFFQSALSLAAFIRYCRSTFVTAGRSLPLFQVEKTPWGSVRIKVSEKDDDDLMIQDTAKSSLLCTTPQLLKDYNQLVRQHKWKPKLDTVAEKKSRHKNRLPLRRRRSSKSKIAS